MADLINQVLITITTVIPIFVIFYFITVFKKGFRISGKGINIDTIGRSDLFLIAIEKTIEVTMEIMQIELIDQLKEQMCYVEDQITAMHLYTMSRIKDWFKKKLHLNHVDTIKDIKMSESFITHIYNDMKALVRSRLTEMKKIFYNDETDLNKLEIYYDNISRLIYQKVLDQALIYWVSLENQTDEEAADLCEELKPYQIEEVKNILRQCYHIQLKYKKRKDVLKNQQKDAIKKVFSKEAL